MSIKTEPTTKSIPSMHNAGIRHVVAAAELGIGVQPTQLVTISGATHSVLFTDLVGQNGGTMQAPIDDDYLVFVCGDSEAKCDLATRTLLGFDLVGGTAADEVALLIVGRFGAMVR